jgi:hypothetical protein
LKQKKSGLGKHTENCLRPLPFYAKEITAMAGIFAGKFVTRK